MDVNKASRTLTQLGALRPEEKLSYWSDGHNGSMGVSNIRILRFNFPMFGKPKFVKEYDVNAVVAIRIDPEGEHYTTSERTMFGGVKSQEKVKNIKYPIKFTFQDKSEFTHIGKNEKASWDIFNFFNSRFDAQNAEVERQNAEEQAKRDEDLRVQAEYARKQLEKMEKGQDDSEADPKKILAARFAKGEITKKEYEEMKKSIE